MKYDFVAIGDIVTDAFIQLKDSSAHIDIDRGAKEICMRFADKIPYEAVYEIPAVGNSANAAVAAARLGLSSALAANLGADQWGKDCLQALKEEGVGRKFMKVHKNKKTNYHYVLWYENDRTILVKHEEYEYALPNIGEPKWIYLSSLGGAAEKLHDDIAQYLAVHPNVKLAFQPGTFQMKLGKERLKEIYARTDLFFCNKEEAQRILGVDDADIKNLLRGIRALGPKLVVITDGPDGAYVLDGETVLFMPPYPDPKPPFERTGAGDAFSATFTAALALGLSVPDALRWAPINSMSVVQFVGAREGLLSREKIENYLRTAPQTYVPQTLR
jgi:sugar/nucleoside kinase (ribokinase family)